MDVDATNILFCQSPRNRHFAEALALCGLVERSVQVADRMFKADLEEDKLPLDFNASTGESVVVALHGAVQDEAFIAFLQRIAAEKEKRFSVADLVVLDAVHRGLDIPEPTADRLTDLITLGAVDRLEPTRPVLTKSFDVIQSKPCEYAPHGSGSRNTERIVAAAHDGFSRSRRPTRGTFTGAAPGKPQ